MQIYEDQFPFQAPQAGYTLGDLIDMPVADNLRWAYGVKRNYFIQTATGEFGRMVFEMVAGGDNFCEIDCYFNPSGSRNLETAQ